LAKHIVEQKSGEFDPEKFEDRYENALTDLINAKRTGKTVKAKARPSGENVIDLMDALKKSIAGQRPESPTKAKRGRSKKAPPGQREMLLPISGKKAAKAPAKSGTARKRKTA
jgi:DNA end-binding protein Ku